MFLEVAKALLDGEATPVELHDLRPGLVFAARGEAPRLLHVLCLHADDGGHLPRSLGDASGLLGARAAVP